jgi:1,4-dihydroxy-6-naphthoate synthase
MTLTLGFTPCPNDTFIFDALVNKKIDTGNMDFEVVMEDVETLNQYALQEKLDISKLSFPAFFKSANTYVLLNSGGALGEGVGPLLISNSQMPLSKIPTSTIAIPGINTTANLLLSFAFPAANQKVTMRFDEIEDAVLKGKTTLGVIIHESRFTYQLKGLTKVVDLGAFWEQSMRSPIPLGGIAIKRSIEKTIRAEVNKLIRESVLFAYENYPPVPDFVKDHAVEMDEKVMEQHIELYVNDFSLDIGERGKEAIDALYTVYKKMDGIEKSSIVSNELFI